MHRNRGFGYPLVCQDSQNGNPDSKESDLVRVLMEERSRQKTMEGLRNSPKEVLMISRRDFLGASAALLPAAAAPPGSAAAQKSASITKAILISMLPKELSYLDRFKLAVDIGFNARGSSCPPSGRIWDRFTRIQKKRLANPFAISARSMWVCRSSTVEWPTIEMCAPVAFAGEFFPSVSRSPVSHALRM